MCRIVLLVLMVAGCGSSYVYRPSENATATEAGRTAAKYDVPSELADKGDVRVTSFGVSKIQTNQGEVKALQARLVVANNSDTLWVLDTRQQIAELSGGIKLAPQFAQSDAGDLPLVTIAPKGKRTVDLYYPLPATLAKASQIPSFDVTWQLNTGDRLVVQRTPFERMRIDPYYASPYWGYPYYFGPYRYADPYWGRGPVVIGAPGWYW